MAITNGYVTLDEVKTHLQVEVSTWNVKLENTITSVSRWIDNHCERHFWQDGSVGSEVPRVFDVTDPRDLRRLRLGIFNDLVSASEVATDTNGDGTFDRIWSASEYQLLPLNASAAPEQRPYTDIRALDRDWPCPDRLGRLGRIRVTGIWGWPEVPQDIHEACLMQVARIFKRRESPDGVAGFSEFGTVRVSGRPDPDVATNLSPYVHPQAALVA